MAASSDGRLAAVRPLALSRRTPRARLLDVWPEAEILVADFWRRVARDERLSPAFRDLGGAWGRGQGDR